MPELWRCSRSAHLEILTFKIVCEQSVNTEQRAQAEPDFIRAELDNNI